MTSTQTESVREILAALHAHRVQTMDPAALAINVNQRRKLVDTVDRDGFIKVGDAVEPCVLADVEGGEVALEALLEIGPVVLLFFRFADCPACNLAMPYYQRRLAPAVEALGATLLAVSPQVPGRLVDIKRRHNLTFKVASDTDNALGQKFGILYSFDEPSRVAALAKGSWIGEVTGTGTWELPMPAVIVIDQDRRVRFVDVSPDWMVRTEAEPILDTLEEIALDGAPRALAVGAR